MNWPELVHPETANVILGKRGSGKSGLAYFLMEDLSAPYNLQRCVIDFPPNKRHLLPPDFALKPLDDGLQTNNAIILIDEGTTHLPAGQPKLEELVKGAQALSRQRNQIILFVFHASSDVGSRILRGLDVIIAKEPSKRQIQWGSKDEYFRQFLLEAKNKLSGVGKEACYVDSEEPEFRGLRYNPLPSFWSDGLSRVWAGVQQSEELSQEEEEAALEYEGRFLLRELKDWSRQAGISPSGTKRDLIERLIAAGLLEDWRK